MLLSNAYADTGAESPYNEDLVTQYTELTNGLWETSASGGTPLYTLLSLVMGTGVYYGARLANPQRVRVIDFLCKAASSLVGPGYWREDIGPQIVALYSSPSNNADWTYHCSVELEIVDIPEPDKVQLRCTIPDEVTINNEYVKIVATTNAIVISSADYHYYDQPRVVELIFYGLEALTGNDCTLQYFTGDLNYIGDLPHNTPLQYFKTFDITGFGNMLLQYFTVKGTGTIPTISSTPLQYFKSKSGISGVSKILLQYFKIKSTNNLKNIIYSASNKGTKIQVFDCTSILGPDKVLQYFGITSKEGISGEGKNTIPLQYFNCKGEGVLGISGISSTPLHYFICKGKSSLILGDGYSELQYFVSGNTRFILISSEETVKNIREIVLAYGDLF